VTVRVSLRLTSCEDSPQGLRRPRFSFFRFNCQTAYSHGGSLRSQKNRTVFAPTFRSGGFRQINSRKPDGFSTAQGVVAVGGGYIGPWFLAVKQFLKKVHDALRHAAKACGKPCGRQLLRSRSLAQLTPLFIAISQAIRSVDAASPTFNFGPDRTRPRKGGRQTRGLGEL
jgi:hypothetical protein